MNEQLSATIIPFPVRFRQPVSDPTIVDPTPVTAAAPAAHQARANDLAGSARRLSQALAGLSTALADQRDATQRWKAALEDLAAKMRQLGEIDAAKQKSG